MKLNHIAIYVKDLEAAKNFYEAYFGAEANSGYLNLKTGLKTYFLTFDNETRIELMTKPELQTGPDNAETLGYTHIAFSTGSRDEVDILTGWLKNDGFEVLSGPRVTGDGYYESVVLDADGNRIEITE